MILAIDPGLATCGAALFDNDGNLVDADVFTSKPVKRPRKFVGAWHAEDLGRRGDLLSAWVDKWEYHRPHTVVMESFGIGRSGGATIAMAFAAGIIRATVEVGVFVCTPNDWRPKHIKRARTKNVADRAIARKQYDAQLYEALMQMPDASRVAEMVRGHGRNGSAVVHALDAFGIGRWWLTQYEKRDAA